MTFSWSCSAIGGCYCLAHWLWLSALLIGFFWCVPILIPCHWFFPNVMVQILELSIMMYVLYHLFIRPYHSSQYSSLNLSSSGLENLCLYLFPSIVVLAIFILLLTLNWQWLLIILWTSSRSESNKLKLDVDVSLFFTKVWTELIDWFLIDVTDKMQKKFLDVCVCR